MCMCVYIYSCKSYIPSLLLSGAAGVGVIANGKSETKDDYSQQSCIVAIPILIVNFIITTQHTVIQCTYSTKWL